MNDKVPVFFYGSFINMEVLAKVELVPDDVRVARLDGYDIRIQPLANLVEAAGRNVHGIVCRATHAELERLYRQTWVGTYLPHPVVVETGDGEKVAALCYISPDRGHAPAEQAYIDRIVVSAREYGFPESYIARLERFRKGPQHG